MRAFQGWGVMGLCRRGFGNRDLQRFGGEVGKAFQCAAGGGMGFPAPGCCWRDDAPGDSGGTVVDRTTLKVTMGVSTAWERGKENELLGPERTGRFVWFARQVAGSNGSIPIRLFSGPIGRTGSESWPIDSRTNRTSRSGLIFKTMFLTTFHIYLIDLILKNYYHFTLNFFIYTFNFKCLYFKILNIILLKKMDTI